MDMNKSKLVLGLVIWGAAALASAEPINVNGTPGSVHISQCASAFMSCDKPEMEININGDDANVHIKGEAVVVKGKDGVDGKDGKDGVDGKDGKDGVDGKDGKDGKTGATGAKGEKGDTGAAGAKGEKGDTGAAGKDGVNGKDGINGKDGANGKDADMTVVNSKADQAALDKAISDQADRDAGQDVAISGKVDRDTFDKSQAAQDKEIAANRDGLAQEVIDRKEGDKQAVKDAGEYTDKKVSTEAQARAQGDAKTLNDAKSYATEQDAKEAAERRAGDKATLQAGQTYTDVKVGREETERVAGDARTLRSANSYTDSKFSQLKGMVDDNRDEARAGTAAALAASQIPQVSQGRDFSLGAGLGTYRGENAVAVGISARINERTVTKFAVTADSQSGVGAGAGVSYEW